ncbi:MAG: tryptophan synthase subunit alpha, partial [Flammeovirgaceae bacterium]|nr:tryptophan synthase subunit alpha [Flammeovirgaceae bacterium]
MKNRLTELFEKKKKDVLAVYYTAGYPSLHDTEIIGKTLIEAGTDIIEIGIPFSDPIADGPIIQASNKVALDNGMQVSLLLEQVKVLRSQVSAPIVLMGYLNPVYQYGIHKFLNDAKAAGVDGLILPDLPAKEFEDNFKA